MLESLKHEDLQFHELTPEEKQSRGILARLTGPIASFTKGTRNGRKYSDKLWEKAFDSPLVKEMFKNGGLPGELQHPADRSETDPTKIAIMMPEPPKKDNKGHLVASVDILDTPCGQIAYQLGKYGFKFGISSRGEGDLIQDFSGEESVDPDTYTLNAFDLVLIPACEDARLQFNESLDTKSKTSKLRTILGEALENASTTDRKIMEEALDELEIEFDKPIIEFNEATNKYTVGDEQFNSEKNAQAYIDRFLTEEQVGRQETKDSEQAGDLLQNKPENEKEKPQEPEKDKTEITVNVEKSDKEDDDTEEEILLEDEGQDDTEEFSKEVDDRDSDDSRASWDTDFHRLDVAYNHSFKQFDDMEEDSGLIRDFTDDLDAQGKGYDIYKHKSDPGCTVFFQESLNEGIKWTDLNGTEQLAVEKVRNEIETGKLPKNDYEEFEYFIRYALNTYGDANDTLDPSDPMYHEEGSFGKVRDFLLTDKHCESMIKSYIGISESLNEDKYTEDELWDKFGTTDLDIINAGNEETVELAADDDGAIVEQLQKILKQNKSLEDKVRKLQEKISVGYAKEMKLKEELEGYKQKAAKLSQKTKEIKALNEKLSKTDSLLKENKDKAKDDISKLNESILSKDHKVKHLSDTNARLKESISERDSKIKSLNEKLNEYENLIKSKDNDKEQLREQYETGQKDLEQLRKQYSKKLEQQNQIIEKYQRVAKNSVKRYIESQAIRLGVKFDEIVNRLPKNYSFNDIDTICEDLQEYKFNMSNLPFSQYGLNEGLKVTAKNVKQDLVGVNPDDEITDYDLKIAEAFL